jgi:di/tricarboxylate transporter
MKIMTINALITLIITIVVAVLLIFEILRPDVVGILTLSAIGIFQLLPVDIVFSGFSSSVVITIIGIYILSASLHYTGAAYWLGTQLYRFSGTSNTRLIIATMMAAAFLSLFMNNVAVVGVLLPAIITLAGKAQVPIRRLMIPLAYGTILGGMSTLLTTSNLIVSSALDQAGYQPYTILDFFPIGLPVILLGLIYLLVVDRINRRKFIDQLAYNKEKSYIHRLLSQYDLNDQIFLVNVTPTSPLIGKDLLEVRASSPDSVNILGIIREKRLINYLKKTIINSKDQLIIVSKKTETFCDKHALTIEKAYFDIQPYLNGICSFHEISVPAHMHHDKFPQCKDIPIMQENVLIPLAVSRQEKVYNDTILQMAPLEGDTFLCFGDFAGLMAFQEQTGWRVTQMDPNTIQRPGKWLQSFLIAIFAVIIAAFNIIPVHLAILTGAALLILTGCIDRSKIYSVIDWQTVFLIAGLWPLGLAIKETGLAETLINGLHLMQFADTPWVLAGAILLLSMLFTQIIGGQVAGIISVPITISIAQATGIDPRSLGMAAALGCSFVFLMPFSHPVNLIVTRTGNISVKEFMKLGVPFFILLFISVMLGLHFMWGL